ncbi:MAG: hypothetical protein KF708_09280 [Pirellulales bacterium]|nr:hypothetical protein [Pirellulales bacterium]
MVGVSERQSSEGLLGARSHELVLRVSGGPRDGHVVRLSSTKCAVGSAPNCTLRLRGAGFQPLHCLILRGAERTTIRSWSRDTRLNGRAFDDAHLEAGDRLSVGPLEFDVVETGALAGDVETTTLPCPAADAVPAQAASLDSAAALLEANRTEIARLRADLEAEQNAFETSMRDQLLAFEAQQTAWEATCNQTRDTSEAEHQARLSLLEAREAQLCERETQLARQLDGSQQGQSLLEQERQQIDAQRQAAESQWAELAATQSELARQTEELISRQQANHDLQQRLEQERADLQVRREELEGQRAAFDLQHAELEQQRAQLESALAEQQNAERQQTGDVEQARARYEAEQQRLADELSALAARLSTAEQLTASLRAEKETADTDRATAQQQVAELQRQFDEQNEQLVQLREQLAHHEQQASEQSQRSDDLGSDDLGSDDLGSELAERERQLTEMAAELQTLRAAIATAEGQGLAMAEQESRLELLKATLEEAAQKLESEKTSFDRERREWNDDRTAEETRLRDDRERHQSLEARLQEERQNLSDLQRELEEERKAIELLRGALKPEEPQPSEEKLTVAQLLRDSQSEGETDSTFQQEAEEAIDFSAPKAEAPLNTSDLFRRLGIATQDAEENEEELEAFRRMSAGANERSRQVSRPELPPVVAAPPQVKGEEQEESIEEYMQKLLQRTRRAGDVPSSVASYTPAPVVEEKPTKVVEPKREAADASAAPEVPEEERPVRPRPTAPERGKDMSGLREIANLSARGAIATFDRKKRKHAVLGRCVMAIGMLVLSVVLLVMCQHDPLFYYCGLVGIVFGMLSSGYAMASIVRFHAQRRSSRASRAEEGGDEQQAVAEETATPIVAAEPADVQ